MDFGRAREIANERWNKINDNCQRDEIKYDNWLDTFEESINECKTPIIDLGCGSGNDTLYLVNKGKMVIPCDYSDQAINNIIRRFPEVNQTACFDMAKSFPFPSNYTDIIIADLSLHYFSEKTTFEIIKEIERVLKPNGLLIFRVNSINDINHGAGKGVEIEKHLYKTSDGRYKRFFDEDDINHFFYEYTILYAKEECMKRYAMPKELWKCAVRI